MKLIKIYLPPGHVVEHYPEYKQYVLAHVRHTVNEEQVKHFELQAAHTYEFK